MLHRVGGADDITRCLSAHDQHNAGRHAATKQPINRNPRRELGWRGSEIGSEQEQHRLRAEDQKVGASRRHRDPA